MSMLPRRCNHRRGVPTLASDGNIPEYEGPSGTFGSSRLTGASSPERPLDPLSCAMTVTYGSDHGNQTMEIPCPVNDEAYINDSSVKHCDSTLREHKASQVRKCENCSMQRVD